MISISEFLSPSLNGALSDWCRRDIRIASITSSDVIFNCRPISFSLGERSISASNFSAVFVILLIVPTRFSGNRTIRECSARACRIDCLIHQTAYEINLNPRVSSNRPAALINPKLPSLIKSVKGSPCP